MATEPKTFTAPFCRWWHEQTGEHWSPGLHDDAPQAMRDASEAFEAGRRSTLICDGSDNLRAAVERDLRDVIVPGSVKVLVPEGASPRYLDGLTVTAQIVVDTDRGEAD